MPIYQDHPETGKPIQIHTAGEFDRLARRTAGLPEWDMDDPERPFTSEYDASMREPQSPVEPAESLADGDEEDSADAFSKHIAANARPVEYEDRTSEAARDQGWGPLDVRRAVAPQRPPKPAKRTARFPLHSSKPTRPEQHIQPQVLTETEKALGHTSISEIRKKLEQSSGQ